MQATGFLKDDQEWHFKNYEYLEVPTGLYLYASCEISDSLI